MNETHRSNCIKGIRVFITELMGLRLNLLTAGVNLNKNESSLYHLIHNLWHTMLHKNYIILLDVIISCNISNGLCTFVGETDPWNRAFMGKSKVVRSLQNCAEIPFFVQKAVGLLPCKRGVILPLRCEVLQPETRHRVLKTISRWISYLVSGVYWYI